MDPNDLSGINEDDFDLSDFLTKSIEEMDSKQMANKIRKLEAKLAMNEQANKFGGSSSLMKIGEKFGKIKNQISALSKEMQGLKAADRVRLEIGAYDELKKEVEKMGEENQKFAEVNEKIKDEFGKKNAEMDGKIDEYDRQIKEMKEETVKLGQKVEKLEEELLKTEIVAMKEKKVEKEELANLAERIADLEMGFKFNLIQMKENKLNSADCGPKMTISEGGLVVKYSGLISGQKSVRAQLPIKFNPNASKFSTAYFEVEILSIHPNHLTIGFCTQEFPLENSYVGDVQNSIGIFNKGVIIDGCVTNFRNNDVTFKATEIIGVGIVLFPDSTIKCFATFNGQLMGKSDLPIKFADMQLYPAASMYYVGDSIRANFGAAPWRYNPFQVVHNL